MKTLELKHIAPYLPFSLRFKARNDVWEMTEINTTSQWKVWAGTEWCCKDLKFKPSINCKDNVKGYGFELHEVKPILRPLSDLDKEIEHNGKKFIPIRELESIRKGLDIYKPLNLDYPVEVILETEGYSQDIDLYDGYLVVQKLIEWHFDIFGLHDVGLAIDINEVNNK